MSRYGEGSIWHDDKRGRWVGAIDVPTGDGRRLRRQVTSTKSRADVRRKLAEIRAELDAGLGAPDRATTVGDYLGEWLAHTVPAFAGSPNTVDSYRWAVEHHLVPALGRRRLVELTAEDVERMLRDRAEKGMSRETLRRLRTVLAKALTHAEKRGHVARNVARLADVPKGSDGRQRRSLTPDEARALLVALADHRHEALLTTTLMLGLRPAEALGLCWDSVDLDAGTVTVRRAMKWHRDVPYFGEPKTARSSRAVRAPGRVVALLRTQRARRAEARLALGPDWPEQWDDLVFASEAGTPLDRRNLRRDLVVVTTAAGLGTWTTYELRHSAVSLLAEAGLALHEIADALGTSVRMIEQHYRHRVSDVIETAVEPMERMLGARGRPG